MVGWGVPTYDSHYIFSYMHQTRAGKNGSWNAVRYSNPELDKKIDSLTTGSRQAQCHHRGDLDQAAGGYRLPSDPPSDAGVRLSLPLSKPHRLHGLRRSDRHGAHALGPQPQVEFPTRRGVLTALDGVSFNIGPGEVLGVVGELGAGS